MIADLQVDALGRSFDGFAQPRAVGHCGPPLDPFDEVASDGDLAATDPDQRLQRIRELPPGGITSGEPTADDANRVATSEPVRPGARLLAHLAREQRYREFAAVPHTQTAIGVLQMRLDGAAVQTEPTRDLGARE